jgi:hypothetical protein
MAVPTWTQQVDNIFTTTWSYRKGPAVEQAFKKTPLAFWLKERERVQPLSGHTRIEIILDYGENDTLRWMGRGDTLPVSDPEILTMAYEEWRYAGVNIVRFWQDDQKNKGQARLLNYVESKLNAAERTIWQELERVFFADGTGSKEPNGFQNIIADDPTTGVLHGIDRATYPWFRNISKAASGAFSTYGVHDMRNLRNTLLSYSGTNASDYTIVTDQTTFEAYEDELLGMKRIINQTLADAGFEDQHIMFKGSPFLWSPQSPSAKIYFVNTNAVKLMVDEDEFMSMTEWKPIPDQPNDRMAQIVLVLNMITNRPVVNGVLTGITY